MERQGHRKRRVCDCLRWEEYGNGSGEGMRTLSFGPLLLLFLAR